MRAIELFEDDVSILRKNITSRVNKEENITLLTRIYKVLNTDATKLKIQNALGQAMSDEDEFNVDAVIRKISSIIAAEAGSINEVETFIHNLSNGKILNPTKLLKTGIYNFSDIFVDSYSIEVFDGLKQFGSGQKFKGPGEFALAILSPEISIRSGKGDVTIKGIATEVKAAAGETGKGAGRIGESLNKPTRQWLIDKFEAFELISTLAHLENNKRLNVKDFTRYTAEDIKDKKIREKIGKIIFTEIFDDVAGTNIAKAFASGDPVKTMSTYAEENFSYYQRLEGWQNLLVISFAKQRMVVVKTKEEFSSMQKKAFGSFGAYVVPEKPLEADVQITFSA